MALFGLLTAAALAWTSSALFRYADQLTAIIESVTATKDIQIAILRHDRARWFHEFSGDPRDLETMRAEEAAIWSGVRATKQFVNSRDEALAFQNVEHEIGEYLRVVDAGASRQARRAEIEGAMVAARELASRNVEDAQRVRDHALTINRTADVAGLLSAGLLLGSIAATLWAVRRGVYVPLVRIQAALRSFRSGDKSSRVKPSGVADLREMAAEYNAMADGLSAAEQAQIRFLAGVAHDLRNPLQALKLGAGLLRKKAIARQDEELEKGLSRVETQVGHLDRMIGDLLDRTRIEAGALDLKISRIELRELCGEIAELHRPAAAPGLLDFVSSEEPVWVDADPVRLGQVVTNLVSNAIKYSPSGGRVVVEVGNTGDQAFIAVSDQGIGIHPAEHERIFEPFRRSERTGDIPGVGLGLSVARRIVVAHGGRIEVLSSPGEGAVFRVWLNRASGGGQNLT